MPANSLFTTLSIEHKFILAMCAKCEVNILIVNTFLKGRQTCTPFYKINTNGFNCKNNITLQHCTG